MKSDPNDQIGEAPNFKPEVWDDLSDDQQETLEDIFISKCCYRRINFSKNDNPDFVKDLFNEWMEEM